MKYLHVAVIEHFEECFVSYSTDDLYEQVKRRFAMENIAPPTSEEWKVCILGESDADMDIIDPAKSSLGLISYYRTESKLEN